MKRLRIYHRQSGLTLREYIQKFSFNAKFDRGSVCSFVPSEFVNKEIGYVTDETLRPGFFCYYMQDMTTFWLSSEEFRVVLGPIPEESQTTYAFEAADAG